MICRIAIGTSSFGSSDRTPLDMLAQAGAEVIDNPYGRRMNEDEIIAHLEGADGLLAGLEPLTRSVMRSAPQLRAIARVGIGMDNVDMKAARELGIRVSNTPDGPTRAVAEMCLAALLSLSRQLIPFNNDVHEGIWKKRMGTSLNGTKVLLIGYGRIGRRFGELLRSFGAEIMVSDPGASQEALEHGEQLVSLTQGLEIAEVISLHAGGKDTILGEAEFQKMRPGMILLNSARAGLIDEHAFVRSLENGTVSSAWTDVFWKEPYSGRLREFDQVLLTPHVSTYTRQCRRAMETEAVRNLLRDLGVHFSDPGAKPGDQSPG